ncbi:MAG: hypothetical protein RR232_06250 [Clostridia bacterium]
MFNAYDLVKKELSELLKTICASAGAEHICVSVRGCEAASALPLSKGLCAEECKRAICSALSANAPGADMVERVTAQNGRLCFELTNGFYDAALCRINATPMPQLPQSFDSQVEYALCRMIMAARKPHSSCPLDDGVRRLVWRSFSIVSCADDPKRLHARLREVSAAALALGVGLSIRERDTLMRNSAAACAAVARLIAFGIENEGGIIYGDKMAGTFMLFADI